MKDIKIILIDSKWRIISALFFIYFLLSGCGFYHNYSLYSSEHNNIDYPAWIQNPSSDTFIGGVGMSSTHVRGVTGQRELAVKRALEDIARQLEVEVENISVISSKQISSSKYNNTKIESYSTHKTKKNIKAYIKEVWVHPVTKEMYVYMIAE